MRNRAELSQTLSELFPQGVVATDLSGPGNPAFLFPEEAKYIAGATSKRIYEFAAGRLCARRALEELGMADHPLCVNDDRSPQWPKGIVGSISHTRGFCGAVVAKRGLFLALGLDVEIVEDVTPDIWPNICVQSELAYLSLLPESQKAQCAALVFCVKEAFYKCQYGITKKWLDFHEVRVDLENCNTNRGSIAVRALEALPMLQDRFISIQCNFRIERGVVFAGAFLVKE